MTDQSSPLPSLEEVDAFIVPDMLIPRLMKNYNYTEETASDLVKEAKRMLYLSPLSGQPISPSIIIDDAWHEMLMFTRFYQKFADFIQRFVHHDPTPGPPDGGKMYRNTKMNYEKCFGIAPDPRYWP